MELVIYNARPLQKTLSVLCTLSIVFLCLLGYFFGEMYKSMKDTIIMSIIIFTTILLGTIAYFLVRKVAKSKSIFNEEGIKRYKGIMLILDIRWEDVSAIGHYKMFDLLGLRDWGPGYFGIDYIDNEKITKSIEMPLSERDAKKIQNSLLNTKVERIINPNN